MKKILEYTLAFAAMYGLLYMLCATLTLIDLIFLIK